MADSPQEVVLALRQVFADAPATNLDLDQGVQPSVTASRRQVDAAHLRLSCNEEDDMTHVTHETGIARLLSDRPTEAVSFDWLKEAHEAKLALCTALEEIADSLPANVNRQKCMYAAKSLMPLVSGVHRYEEETVFPLFQRSGSGDVAGAIERLKFEHVEDECFAEELTDTLTRLGKGDVTVNAEATGYMLRGFFESIRRHIAFERQFMLRETAPAS
jgi:hemerythrin-like domain-containing protein